MNQPVGGAHQHTDQNQYGTGELSQLLSHVSYVIGVDGPKLCRGLGVYTIMYLLYKYIDILSYKEPCVPPPQDPVSTSLATKKLDTVCW